MSAGAPSVAVGKAAHVSSLGICSDVTRGPLLGTLVRCQQQEAKFMDRGDQVS